MPTARRTLGASTGTTWRRVRLQLRESAFVSCDSRAHYEPWRNRESSHARLRADSDDCRPSALRRHGNVRDGLGSDEEDTAGGGHAHCGTMIYLGDNWPERYRNTLFTNNIHGRRHQQRLLRRAGSDMRLRTGHDLMLSKDPWYMGVTLALWPRRRGLCQRLVRHRGVSQHQEHPPRNGPDLQDLLRQSRRRDKVDLAAAQRSGTRRTATVTATTGTSSMRGGCCKSMRRKAATCRSPSTNCMRCSPSRPTCRVSCGRCGRCTRSVAIDARFLDSATERRERIRSAWAVRLLCEDRDPPAEALKKFRELAATGDSAYRPAAPGQCRCNGCGPRDCWPIAEALVTRGEDADDETCP